MNHLLNDRPISGHEYLIRCFRKLISFDYECSLDAIGLARILLFVALLRILNVGYVRQPEQSAPKSYIRS